MTIDPDGAMHDWVDLPDGWQLTRIPTQEAVHLIGIPAYQDLLVDLCEREAPHVLVTHPPYDWLDARTAERIRATGTRLVGYAFDDEIFAGNYDTATRAALAKAYDRYATTRDIRWATAPLPPLSPAANPDIDVVLVGQAYDRRHALVDALRAAGFRVVTRGSGWSHGYIARDAMLELYAGSAVVLTTADWEAHAVPMVKHRLLDTAMLGAFQIAQDAPDLRSYFPADEVPSFTSATDLVDSVRAALADPAARRGSADAARTRALAEHTWRTRFPQLIDGLTFSPRDAAGRSQLLDQLLIALASRAETSGRLAAAHALYAELLRRAPDQATAHAGFGRCARDLGDHAGALEHLRTAAAASQPIAAAAVHARLPGFGIGAGLGRLAQLPPSAEPIAIACATYAELGRIDDAVALLDAIADRVLARALAEMLVFGDDPTLAPLQAAVERLRARFAVTS